MHLPLKHCTLRDFRTEDGGADRASLVRYANNPKIAQNLRDGFPHPYTEAAADRFLAMVSNQSPRTVFAITVNDEVVGGIGVHPKTDVERVSAELGYWLAEPFWGRGIVTEAVVAITDWAFANLPLTRVFALPFATNPASARVLEKANFTFEGRLRRCAIKGGVVIDQLMYSRVREDVPQELL